jgi:hypothetical protein
MFGFTKKSTDSTTHDVNDVGFAPAPGTEIRYNPALIMKLTQQHARLLDMHRNVQNAVRAAQYQQALLLLRTFRAEFEDHLLEEKIRLYIYLDRTLGRHEVNGQFVRDSRRDMEGIGRSVMDFLRKVETDGLDATTADEFERGFNMLGTVLGARVKHEEESLYPLYLPA